MIVELDEQNFEENANKGLKLVIRSQNENIFFAEGG